MPVFVAGATGAIGRQLVPRLVAAGHEVLGMTRSESKRGLRSELGAVPVVADALDPDQVAEVVGRASPNVIVHQLTAIGAVDMRHAERDFAPTNRLRTLARPAAAREPGGPGPPRGCGPRSRWTEGIVLRYGWVYGPGTSLAPGSPEVELIRRRKIPVVGDGGAVWSFIHVADAADATMAAIEHGTRGVYNVIDDDPAPVAEWLPALAQRLGAKRPMRRQGPGAVAERTHPRCARADRLGPPDRAPSRRVAAPRRGQRRPGSALSRRTAAAHRRRGARHRRR